MELPLQIETSVVKTMLLSALPICDPGAGGPGGRVNIVRKIEEWLLKGFEVSEQNP